MFRVYQTLLWKEWQAQKPFFFLTLVVFVIFLINPHFNRFIDQHPVFEFISFCESYVIYTFILAVVGALGLLTREKDEGQLFFLDGLPVTRFSMYITKWIVVFLIVSGFGIATLGEVLVYEWLSLESDSPATPWGHVAAFFLLNSFLAAFFISFVFAISPLRLWALLLIGAAIAALLILRGKGLYFANLIDPFSLVDPPYAVDDEWSLPWLQIGILGAMGVVFWIIGLLFYSNKDGSTTRGFQKFIQSTWGTVCFLIMTFVILITMLVAFVSSANPEDFEEPPPPVTGAEVRPPVQGGNAIASYSTEKFDFVYRKSMQKRLMPLMAEADEIFAVVATFLEANEEEVADKITVDLTNPLGSHNAGQAYWNKIRMGFPSRMSLAEARWIFGHEVTHVVIDRITKGRMEEIFNTTRWFHEGLASYVEFDKFREAGDSKEYEHWLALASTYGEIHFNELVQNHVLSARRDTNLVYPVGLEWVRAAVDVYGEEFPAKLLRSFSRPDGPRKLTGIARWRDACLAAGYDIERIRSRFRQRLDTHRETHKEMCAKLPEVKKGKVTRLDGKIIVKPELPENWREDAPDGAALMCRLRQNAEASPHEWKYSMVDGDGAFSTDADFFLKPKLDFQVGWRIKGWAGQPVFGKWIEAKVE